MNPILTAAALPLLGALLHAGFVLTAGWLLVKLWFWIQHSASAARQSAALRVLTATVLVTFAWSLGQAWKPGQEAQVGEGFQISQSAESFIGNQNQDTGTSEQAGQSEPAAGSSESAHSSQDPAYPPHQAWTARASEAASPITSANDPTLAASAFGGRLPFHLTLPPGLVAILRGAWTCGALVLTAIWLTGLAARHRLFRDSSAVTGEDWLQAAFGEELGCAAAIRLHSDEVTPCAWGIWKPVILLPHSAERWPVEKLRLVLAHENAHLSRRDPAWCLAHHLMLSLFWFHPCAWDLIRRSREADERAADDTVLRLTADAPAYAALLVDCARRLTLPSTLNLTASAMSAPSTSLTRRVETLLNSRADRRPAGSGLIVRWSLTAAALAILCGLALPRLQAAPEALPLPPAPPSTTRAPKSELIPPDPAPVPVPPKAEVIESNSSATPSETAPAPADPAAAPPGAEVIETVPDQENPASEASQAEAEEKTKSTGFDWKVVTLEDRDYVSASRIAAYYGFPSSTSVPPEMILRSPNMIVKGAEGSRELRINNVLFILQHPVVLAAGDLHLSRKDLVHLIEPACRPNRLGGKFRMDTVILDAGHGGRDSGAVSPAGKEAALTLDLALRLKKILEDGHQKVLLTRDSDVTVPLSERVALVAAQKDAVVVSLHFDFKNKDQQGFQTFVPEGEDLDTGYLQASRALATAVHANCLKELRSHDGGIRAASFKMLRGQSQNPAITVEAGNLNNPEDAARITDPDYRQKLAESIAIGLQRFARAMK